MINIAKAQQRGSTNVFLAVAITLFLTSLFGGLLAYSFYKERIVVQQDLIDCQEKHPNTGSMAFQNCIQDVIDSQG